MEYSVCINDKVTDFLNDKKWAILLFQKFQNDNSVFVSLESIDEKWQTYHIADSFWILDKDMYNEMLK